MTLFIACLVLALIGSIFCAYVWYTPKKGRDGHSGTFPLMLGLLFWSASVIVLLRPEIQHVGHASIWLIGFWIVAVALPFIPYMYARWMHPQRIAFH